MVHEYNSIVDSAVEICDFNWDLLRTLEIQTKDIYKKTGKNGVDNINKEVLDIVVDSYIKLDKNVVIIKNKINNLINLII